MLSQMLVLTAPMWCSPGREVCHCWQNCVTPREESAVLLAAVRLSIAELGTAKAEPEKNRSSREFELGGWRRGAAKSAFCCQFLGAAQVAELMAVVICF